MDDMTTEDILEHAQTYHAEMGDPTNLEAFEEHGGVFVTNVATGASWSAHHCSGHECLCFEQIDQGDED